MGGRLITNEFLSMAKNKSKREAASSNFQHYYNSISNKIASTQPLMSYSKNDRISSVFSDSIDYLPPIFAGNGPEQPRNRLHVSNSQSLPFQHGQKSLLGEKPRKNSILNHQDHFSREKNDIFSLNPHPNVPESSDYFLERPTRKYGKVKGFLRQKIPDSSSILQESASSILGNNRYSTEAREDILNLHSKHLHESAQSMDNGSLMAPRNHHQNNIITNFSGDIRDQEEYTRTIGRRKLGEKRLYQSTAELLLGDQELRTGERSMHKGTQLLSNDSNDSMQLFSEVKRIRIP